MENRPGLLLCHEKRGDDLTPLINEKEHQRVLNECIDVPHQQPENPIRLTDVGISGKTVWVRLPQGLLPFAARLYVSLQSTARGIHMSRMEEVISDLHERHFADLTEYAVALAERMMLRQDADAGRLFLEGKLPVKRQGSVSRKLSIDSMDVSAEVQVRRHDQKAVPYKVRIGTGVCHITACPCTQVYNQTLYNTNHECCPLPTHSQRSITHLRMDSVDGFPSYGDLLACLEESLHVTQDLLKRQDEAEIVLKSHSIPQFAEDAVRATARAVTDRFYQQLPHDTGIEIESVSLESIHIHDVHCRLETTLAALHEQLT